jgi:hypothetical protein
VALFVAWLAYYLPGRVGSRQQLVDARTSDRFSGGLRVLAVAGGASTPGPSPAREHTSATKLITHDHRPSEEETDMASAPVGRPRRARPAAVSAVSPARRRAAARRRLTLTLALVALTVVMFVGAMLGAILWPVVVVPVAFLAIVLVLGRRAVVAGRQAEEARFEAARMRAVERRRTALGAPPLPRAADRQRVTGHAVRTSQHATQMIPRVTAADLERAARRVAPPAPRAEVGVAPAEARAVAPAPMPVSVPVEVPVAPESRAWDPVPVPPPTYALKAAAPRPARPQLPEPLSEPLPAPVAEADLVGLSAPGTVSAEVRPEPSGQGSAASAAAGAPADADEPRPTTETLGLSLDAILARRRASGE